MQEGRAEADLGLVPESSLFQMSGAEEMEENTVSTQSHSEPGAQSLPQEAQGKARRGKAAALPACWGLHFSLSVCSPENGRCRSLRPAPKRMFM